MIAVMNFSGVTVFSKIPTCLFTSYGAEAQLVTYTVVGSMPLCVNKFQINSIS